jgi:hypothetical protein
MTWVKRRFGSMLRDLNYAVMLPLVGKSDFKFLSRAYITADLPNEETYNLICTFPEMDEETYGEMARYMKKTGKNYLIQLIPTIKPDTIDPCETPSTDPTTRPPATLATS